MSAATRRTLSRDTSPDAEEVQIEIYRRMTAAQKIELVDEANRLTRDLVMTGLRRRHPEASDEELFRCYVGLTLGEELATAAYGPLEDHL
jgi:hypothetical protein